MDKNKLASNIVKSIDTQDLMEHIAWTDVVKPKLLNLREMLSKQLVNAVLDPALSSQKEQIAGKIFGIDYIINIFEGILSKGKNSQKALAELGIHFEV